MTDSVVKSEKTVIIKGNRIVSVSDRAKIPSKAIVVDATGKYLIPGLCDMHVHTLLNGRPSYFFPLFIANGITTIRDMGANISLDSIQLLRQQFSKGQLIAPRLQAVCGKILDGEGSTLGQGLVLKVKTAEEAKKIVQLYKQQGADFVKAYDMLSREVYLAIIEEAEKQQLYVEGHVPFSMTATEASGLGQRSIEHITDVFISSSTKEDEYRKELQQTSKTAKDNNTRRNVEIKAVNSYDSTKAADLFATFVKNSTWQCPTLALRRKSTFSTDSLFINDARMRYIPLTVKEQWKMLFQQRDATTNGMEQRIKRFQKSKEVVRDMHLAGVNILAGTDILNTYLLPGFSLHEELEVLVVEAGLSPFEALKAATSNPAKFLHIANDFGTIEKDKIADLVLLDANPLQDIKNTKKIAAVILDGRLFRRKDLDALLQQAEDFAKKQ